MRDTKVINLYGGPGIGKSTLAAKIFAHLKDRNISCELVQEFAKELVWEEDWDSLASQTYVTGVQHSRIERLYGKVDYIVSDSPISLGLIYGKGLLDAEKEVIVARHKEFNNIEVFLTRHKNYDPEGRIQIYEEALECDKEILNLMSELYPDKEVKVFSNEADKSVKFLEEVLGLPPVEVKVRLGAKDLIHAILVREHIKKVMYSNPEDYMECAGFKTRIRELKTLEDKIKKEYPDMYEAYYYEYL